MSLVQYIDHEEMTFREGVLVVLGWFALIAIVGFIVAYYSIGV